MTCTAGVDARDAGMSRDAIAATAIQLALGFPTWVRRRKWTFSFVDDATIRQQQSVCFRLPAPDDVPLAKVDATILVPLWIARKVPMTNVDMRDEEGRALSIMSKQENGEASARGLYRILLGLRARADAPPSGAVAPEEDPALLDVPKERLSRSLAVTLGLRDKERSIHDIQIGWSLSTHVQVTAPPDVDIGQAWLDVKQHDPAAGGPSHRERHHVVYDRPDAEMSVSVLADWDFAQPTGRRMTPIRPISPSSPTATSWPAAPTSRISRSGWRRRRTACFRRSRCCRR